MISYKETLDNLREWKSALFRKPFRVLGVLLIIILFFCLAPYFSGYISEKGKQAASSDEMVAPPLAQNEEENKYFHHTKISPIGNGKYGLIVEFGVRDEPTNGVHVGIDVGAQYTDVREWFAPPNRTDVLAKTSGIYYNSSKRKEPPIYSRRFSDPSITPQRSFYLYFESEQPFQINKYLYLGYYD